MSETEILFQCLRHFAGLDESNAAVHCAPVRWSPISFRLAEALNGHDLGEIERDVVKGVLAHAGAYPEDTGR